MYGGTNLCNDLISPAVVHAPNIGGEYSKTGECTTSSKEKQEDKKVRSDDKRKMGSGFKGIEMTQERDVHLGGIRERVGLEALQ